MASEDHSYCVYILTNDSRTVLYTGVTNNLMRRLREHKGKITPGFTKKYKTYKLVYLEIFQYVTDAIDREKQIKRGSRAKKIALIEKQNPEWDDLLAWFQ